MNDRFKFRIAVYERQQNNMPWVFVEYIDPENQHWGLNQCGDIISDSSYSAHYTRKNAPDSVHRVYEPEMPTGLKDKNGNPIYEGDVVNGRYFNPYHPETPNPKIKGVVRFIQDRMTWIIEDGDEGYDFEDCMPTKEYFEITGNIHEQAEQKDK